jgi:membrane associated rhomboid family serine protease
LVQDYEITQGLISVNQPTVGASGALFGILVAFAMYWPNTQLFLMFIPVPIKAKWAVIGYAAFELFAGISGFQAGVAHFAHLGGALFGFILVQYWNKNNRNSFY